MKLNSSQLEAFFAVAKTLHFTKAAEVLHVTQSALSQRIAKLEEDLETTLFVRDRNSIRLTEAGQSVLRFCQLNESAEGELLQKLKGSAHEYAGVLKIGGFSTVNKSVLIPALKKLMLKNPQLSLQIFTKEIYELSGLLQSSEADYILTTQKSDSPDIESLFLGYEENVLVGSKKHLDTNIFLDHDPNDSTTKNFFAQQELSFKPTAMRYLDDIYGIIEGVKNGFGKAVVPRHLVEDEKEIEILDSKKVLWVAVYLQYFKQPFYRQTHQIVLAEIQNYFSKILAQKI